MSIIGILLLGLIVGALARLLVPGRGPTGILATMAVGVGGAFLGWWIGKSLVGTHGVGLHPWIWALLGSALLVLAYRAVSRRGRYSWGRRRYFRW